MMGLAEEDKAQRQQEEASAVLRVLRLPLLRSALQSVTLAYAGVKGQHPLLELMGGVAEVGVRSVSHEAMRRATAVLQSLEPQIEVANTFAHAGLSRLEKNFPILTQSTDEVKERLKDAFFVTLDDMQLWVAGSLEGALVQLEHLTNAAREVLQHLQDSQLGRAAASGLDDMLRRLEDATVHYLPLPPTLRLECEMRVQQLEDEDDEDEPSLWMRVQSLLLHLSLQLYHRINKDRDQLQEAVRTLVDAAVKVGLGQVLALVGDLLLYLHSFMVMLVYRAGGLRAMTLKRVRSQAGMLAQLSPVRQVWRLPIQIQHLLRDLQELSKLVLQLVINVTPLYNMLQQPSDQEVEDFLNKEDFSSSGSSRRSSAHSLFLKAMDGRPRRRRSLNSLATGGSGGRQSPDPPDGRSSLKDPATPEAEGSTVPSHDELLLSPLQEFISQSQKAFEYLSPNEPSGSANDPFL
ncbi:perilipin 6 [Betta splendens]|uniref:Perilipin 6 n=1 Tax=Betta splendens TaxID=158456 RepID=A0A6P7KPY6_BETSP|nr:perilipin 6 [Betta splendens]